jgi:putative selenate reductase molybdopterin-binding subunit
VYSSDTAFTPVDVGASASSTFSVSGGAVKKAAEQVRRQILVMAGHILNVLPELLRLNVGVISTPQGATLTIAQIASHALYVEGRQLMSSASWKGQETPPAFGAYGVELEVDTETGSTRILKVVAAIDAGRVTNPLIAEGQILGSIAQGLGAALSEELLYDRQGRLLTTNLDSYHIYNSLDMPEAQVYFIESDEPRGLLGAKAVAELPLGGIAPALANALSDAVGVRIRQLPLTPERVLRALHAQAAKR